MDEPDFEKAFSDAYKDAPGTFKIDPVDAQWWWYAGAKFALRTARLQLQNIEPKETTWQKESAISSD